MKHIPLALLALVLCLAPALAQPGKIIDQKPIPQASPLDIKLPPEVLLVLNEMSGAAKQMKVSLVALESSAITGAWYDGIFRGAVGMGILGVLLYLGVEKYRSKAP